MTVRQSTNLTGAQLLLESYDIFQCFSDIACGDFLCTGNTTTGTSKKHKKQLQSKRPRQTPIRWVIWLSSTKLEDLREIKCRRISGSSGLDSYTNAMHILLEGQEKATKESHIEVGKLARTDCTFKHYEVAI